MRFLEPDRTRILKESVSELTPSDLISRFGGHMFGMVKSKTLMFFDESCDHLVAYSIDDLWRRYGCENPTYFSDLLAVRDRLLGQFSKSNIQYIRDEFERVGVKPRPIDMDNIANHPPIFNVQSRFGEIIVHGNLFRTVNVGSRVVQRPLSFISDFSELKSILNEIPSGMGEESFWESVKVHEAVRHVQQELEKKQAKFRSGRYRSEKRSQSKRVSFTAGKYAGHQGYLIDHRGSHVRVEVELSPGNWHLTTLPATSIKVLE